MSTELDTLRERVMIETRMEACRDAAASNLVEIGMLLNRAKDGGLVPHGEWTSWVQEHAGMNERTAQRVMRIARELPAGSPLASLGVAKLSALLTLPEGEREDAAKEMDAEHLTSREVEERVRAIKQERDEALRLLAEKKNRMQETVSSLTGIIQQDDKEKKRTAKQLNESRAREENLRRETEELRAALEIERAKPAVGPNTEASKEIERLKMTINDQSIEKKRLEIETKEAIEKEKKLRSEAEKEIDRLSDELDQARTDALRAGCAAGADRQSPVTLILSAIGALMAEAGNAPGELSRTAGIDEATEQLLIGQAQLVGQWAMSIIAACGGETHA